MRLQPSRSIPILITALLALCLATAWGQADSPSQSVSYITIPASADTYITNRFPQTNFGGNDYLELWYDAESEAAGAFLLFRFELQEALGSNVIIDSATLELYQIEQGSGADPATVYIHPILESWDENEVTYNNQPDVYAGPFLTAALLDAGAGWKQIDVTQYADNWLAGDGYGVELRSTATAFERVFESDEHNEHVPRLIIDYHLPDPTPTATATLTPKPDIPVTLNLCATADAYVSEGKPATNYGASDILRVGFGQDNNEPFAYRSLARFDLSFIPPGSEIVDAHFEAGQVIASGQSMVQLSLYAVRGPWNEMSVNWNNQPPISPQPAAIVQAGDGTPAVVAWEIRTLVREWVDGGLENNGLELKGLESGASWLRQFDSRHYTPFCPRLMLEVIPDGPMPTPSPTPTPPPTPTPTPTCPQPDTAGNTFVQAAPLVPFKEMAEYLCPSGDLDYWKFPVEVGQEIKLNLWGMPGDYDLVLLDPDGALVKESSLWGTGKSEYIYHLSYRGGEYRALVKGKGVADWHPNQPYKLRVDLPFKCFEADEAGNDITSAATVLPSLPQGNIQRPISAAICPAGDVDFFRFYVPGGQLVNLRIDLSDLAANYDLALYDPAHKLAHSSAHSGTAPEWIEVISGGRPGYWSISVYGPSQADGSLPYHSQPYLLDIKLSSTIDLTVRDIEITQAIQNLDNSLTLADGKLTLARVYVGGAGAPGPLSGVEVKLTAWRMVWGVPQPLPGEVTATVDNLPLLSLHQSRLNSASSVNLYLPDEWTRAGDLRLRAEVNYTRRAPETDFSNNVATAGVAFHAVQPINLGLVAVQANGLTINPQTDTDVLDMLAWTRQIYPTNAIHLFYLVGNTLTANYNYNFPNPADGTCGGGWKELLNDLENVYDGWPNRPGNAIVFGVMNAAVPPTGPAGCGRVSEGVSAGIMGLNAGPLLAHEMGHNYERGHAPCGLPPGMPWDTSYPTYYDPSGVAYKSGSTGEVGIDTSDLTVFDPFTATDLMSYCHRFAWMSPYTWHGLIFNIPDAFQVVSPPLRAVDSSIVVSGRIVGGVATFDPFWVQAEPASLPDTPGEGPYQIKLLDAQSRVLAERRLTIIEPPVPVNHDTGRFHEWLPYPAGTAAIALYKDGAKLAERTASAHAPQVSLLAPNGGEQWFGAGPFTVRWQATDADGDSLTARLDYSNDGGATWSPLAVNLSTSQLTLDTTYLPGGNQALVKVTVTDGLHTTSDRSDAVFAVDNKPPLIFLLAPRPGERYDAGEPVLLQALATDPEDGPLADDALAWSVPGSLRQQMSGNDIVLSDLMAGYNELSVTVRDEQGLATRRDVGISVGWHLRLPVIGRP